jgi:hypothetical protein
LRGIVPLYQDSSPFFSRHSFPPVDSDLASLVLLVWLPEVRESRTEVGHCKCPVIRRRLRRRNHATALVLCSSLVLWAQFLFVILWPCRSVLGVNLILWVQ